MNIDTAVDTRYTVRSFTQDPVDKELINDILIQSAKAPSSSNIQPWKVYALQGESLKTLSDKVSDAFLETKRNPNTVYKGQFEHYPEIWTSPYIDRRRETGKNLYKLLGISKDDKEGMIQQHKQNYNFFGAPVGFIFTIDGIMGKGSLIDTGMFLQNISLLAHGKGLGTCLLGGMSAFHSIILPHIGADSDEILVCGMAIGWPNHNELINTYRTNRAPLDEFVKWFD